MSTIGNTAAAARDTVDEFLDNTESKFAGAQAAVRPAAQVDSMPPLSGGSGDDNDNNSSGMNLEEMARSIGINCDIVSHIRYFSDVEGSHLSYQIHHPSSLLFFCRSSSQRIWFRLRRLLQRHDREEEEGQQLPLLQQRQSVG